LSMRKSNTQKLGEIVKEYLEQMMIDRKLKEVGIIRSWEELMGKLVAERTKNIYIKNKILFIELKSSVLRNELTMMRQAIIDKINEKAGEKMIEKIVIR
jgi:predicted nucleic acid-binding Zn ribbon protein